MWSSSDHRRCCRRREVTVPCSASWSRCWAASARSSWSRRWAARLQAVRAGASSRPGCSCSPPSASSSSSSTGSGSNARRRSPGPARSTSATSAPSGRWPATPPRSSERRCSGSTPTRGPCPPWRRSGPGSGSTSSPTRCSSTCGTACAAGRSRLELVPPDELPIDQVDPAAASALSRLLAVHRVQPSLPTVVDLRAFDRIEVCGPDVEARALARAILCSAATFQSPEHLAIAVLASEESLAEWDWVKWLPHARSGSGLRRDRTAPDGLHQHGRARLAAAVARARPRGGRRCGAAARLTTG